MSVCLSEYPYQMSVYLSECPYQMSVCLSVRMIQYLPLLKGEKKAAVGSFLRVIEIGFIIPFPLCALHLHLTCTASWFDIECRDPMTISDDGWYNDDAYDIFTVAHIVKNERKRF